MRARRFTTTARKHIFRCAVLGGLLFTGLTTSAMFVYPGGTRDDPTLDHYLFSRNFFSDLGRTADFEGNTNIPSMLLFGSGLTIVGCTTACLFCALPDLFREDRMSKFISFLMMCFGLVAGIGFVGIAFTPWDRFFSQHDFCVTIGFRSLLLACIAVMINIYRARSFPNLYGHLMVAVSVILLSYILLLTFGPSPLGPQGLMIQVAGQKVVAYVLIAGITCLSIGAAKVDAVDE